MPKLSRQRVAIRIDVLTTAAALIESYDNYYLNQEDEGYSDEYVDIEREERMIVKRMLERKSDKLQELYNE